MFGKMVAACATAIALAGCQHTAVEGRGGQPQTEGRILVGPALRGPSASFDAERVIGPAINMSRNPDGTWTGWIRDRAMNLVVAPGKISSAGLTMTIQDLPQGVEIDGLWIDGHQSGDLISMRLTPQELFVRQPFVRPPVYLEANGEGNYGTGLYGNAVKLKGAAALPHPPEPQFALALLGAF